MCKVMIILGILDSNLKINKIYISQRNNKISTQLSKKSKKIIVLKNNTPLEFMGEMQHNIVIFKDESAAPEIIKLAESYFGGDAPDDNRILAKSILIDKQEETTIEFDAPKKPGRYLYVCTYIAHAGSMRGYMIVE